MPSLAENELVDKLVARAISLKSANQMIFRSRVGEKKIDNPPASVIWWDGTISEGDGIKGATSVNQIIHIESSPRIGYASFALSEQESIDCFVEMRNIILGSIPTDITGRRAQRPFEPALADVMMKEGRFYVTAGYASLVWKYQLPMATF